MTKSFRAVLFAFAAFLAICTHSAQAQTLELTSCSVLRYPGATYVLQNNIVAAHTCLSVQADNITINLNGHSVEYATAPDTERHHGILAESCWDTGVGNNPCGGSFEHLTVENGYIVQGVYGAPFSDAIRVGEGPGTGLAVHNVNISVSGPSARAIYTTASGGGQYIYNNTINSTVRTIASRVQMDGVTMHFVNDQAAPASVISGNTIIGSAQGGILPSAPSSKIYGNTIRLNAYYSNDYCIYAWARNVEVYQNLCDSTQGSSMGRGIHIDAIGASVHDNVLKVRELPRNAEYGGCELGGAFGIEFAIKQGIATVTNNSTAYNNTITAYAGVCEASALRGINLLAGTNNVAHDNQFTAIRLPGASAVAAGASFAVVNGGLSIIHNKFVADSAAFYGPWDGVSGVVMSQNTFAIGSNPDLSGWQLAFFNNHYASMGNVITDPTFENGAFESIAMNPINHLQWGGASELFVGWTTTIHVVNSLGAAIAGAYVTIKNRLGKQVFSGTTNRSGNVSAVLVEFRRYNTTCSGDLKEYHTPHTVTVSLPSSTASASPTLLRSKSVQVDTTQTVTVYL